MCLVDVKAYGNRPKTFIEKIRINKLVIRPVHGAELGLVFWKIISRTLCRKDNHTDCSREGAQFVGKINNNQDKAKNVENMFIGIKNSVLGKN